MNKVGYTIRFLGHPAIWVYPGEVGPKGTKVLAVWNQFSNRAEKAYVGDRIRWYPSTKSFSVV